MTEKRLSLIRCILGVHRGNSDELIDNQGKVGGSFSLFICPAIAHHDNVRSHLVALTMDDSSFNKKVGGFEELKY